MKTVDTKKFCKNKSRIFFSVAVLALFALFTVFAGDIAAAARDGLELSLFTAIPALFPFFVVGALLTGSGLVTHLGHLLAAPMRILYKLSGAGAVALVLGLSGGYPVGAQTVCDLYRSHSVSREEAEYLISFCNNTGPAFAVGFAGVAICGSVRMGICLYLIHVLGALLTGLVMTASVSRVPHATRIAAPVGKEINPVSVFLDAVRQSFSTCLTITAFITFFSVLLALLRRTGLLTLFGTILSPVLSCFGLPSEAAAAIAAGAVELTNGLSLLPSLNLKIPLLLPLCSFMLGFGGLSVHCQTLSILQQANISARRHFIGKLLHGILSAALAVLWCHVMPPVLSAFSPSSPAQSPLPFASLLGYIPLAIVLFGIIFPLSIHRRALRKRHQTKTQHQGVFSRTLFKASK